MILSVVRFVTSLQAVDRRPWLIVGKGPSVDNIGQVKLDDYHIVTLNHACNIVKPTIAHFVDIEALQKCTVRLSSPAICEHETHICMPWRPHRGFKATRVTLEEWAEKSSVTPALRRFSACSLLSYNASTDRFPKNSKLPAICLRYFSATAAFNFLIAAGITKIYSIGVDGGTDYAKCFDKSTKLANGRSSFDVQMPEIEAAIKFKQCKWIRLGV